MEGSSCFSKYNISISQSRVDIKADWLTKLSKSFFNSYQLMPFEVGVKDGPFYRNFF